MVQYKLSGSGEIKVAAFAHRAEYRIRIFPPTPLFSRSNVNVKIISVLVLVEQMSNMLF